MKLSASRPRRGLCRALWAGALAGSALPWTLAARTLAVDSTADAEAAAFEARSLDDALRLLGVSATESSDSLSLICPEIAENGAIVPVTVGCAMPGVLRVALLVERNTWPLAAVFDVPAALYPSIATRVKMSQSSPLTVVAIRAEGPSLVLSRPVTVTLGGCGG